MPGQPSSGPLALLAWSLSNARAAARPEAALIMTGMVGKLNFETCRAEVAAASKVEVTLPPRAAIMIELPKLNPCTCAATASHGGTGPVTRAVTVTVTDLRLTVPVLTVT